MSRTALAVLIAATVVSVTGLLTAPSIIRAASGGVATPAGQPPLAPEIACSSSNLGPGPDRCAVQWDNADLIMRTPDGGKVRFVLNP